MQLHLLSWRQARLAVVLISLCGCSGRPGDIDPPDVDPASAAEAAMQQLDKDGDGQLSSAELEASPGLGSAATRYDSDNDGSLSLEEVTAGIRRWAEGEVGAATVPFVVRLDGRPLSDAVVKAIPEPFLGDVLKPATGIDGYLAVAPEDRPPNSPNFPLMQPGLYRIEITHLSVSIPAKYNSETILGHEVSQDTVGNQAVVWSLTTK
jgi:hypothetical protein